MVAGTFNLSVPVDALFFIGSQLVATSHTGKIGVWNSMTQHWQVHSHTQPFNVNFLFKTEWNRISGKEYLKFWVHLVRLPSFPEIHVRWVILNFCRKLLNTVNWKMLFHLPFWKFNWEFLLEWRDQLRLRSLLSAMEFFHLGVGSWVAGVPVFQDPLYEQSS